MSHYETLGVPRTATHDEIRQAYLKKCKSAHPDRFDQVAQRQAWEAANEYIKALNAAYDILSDARSRSDYDASLFGAQGATNRTASRPRRNPSDVKLGKLKAGVAYFSSLPKDIQRKIEDRVNGTNKNQWSVPLWDVKSLYLLVGLCFLWLIFLGYSAAGSRWSSDGRSALFFFTFVAACCLAYSLYYIDALRRTVLRPMFIVTPIYVIKTSTDKVWYWPIWELTSIKATHRYTNSNYNGTTVDLEFGKAKDSVNIQPKTAYDSLVGALDLFTKKIKSARDNEEWEYFFDEDDFREIPADPPLQKAAMPYGRIAAILAISSLICGGVFLLASSYNEGLPQKYVNPLSSSAQKQPQRLAVSQLYPEQQVPASGSLFTYSGQVIPDSELVAPFQISTPLGESCFVKLVEASTGRPVAAYFIQAGSTTKVKVPLGTYEVRYAAGARWYGPLHLFGENTSYSRGKEVLSFRVEGNQVSGYSVTLYPVLNGNMSTESIPAEGF